MTLFPALSLLAGGGVTAGKFTVERPTLICLGFEWRISGDDNRNATVEVTYRKTGDSGWRKALPLLRMGGERVMRPDREFDYTVPDMFAGSLLDLEPGAEYEARFQMRDPDGVAGTAVQTVRVRTRTEPKAAPGGRAFHVYPPNWRGEKQQPAYVGLKAAYYGAGCGDWNAVWPRKPAPGDVLLVHAGLYKGNRWSY